MDVKTILGIIGAIFTGALATIISNSVQKMGVKYKIVFIAILAIAGYSVTSYAYDEIVLVPVPSLNGMPKASAMMTLQKLGLNYNFEEKYDETVPRGVVISQNLTEGPVDKGTTILFIVSMGSSKGTISVNSAPSGAIVYIDNANKGITPLRMSDISMGFHEIKVKKEGYNEFIQSINISGGNTLELYAPLIEYPTPIATSNLSIPPTPDVTAPLPTPIISAPPITLKYSDFDLDKVCTSEDNYCGWAVSGKAIIYGSMTKTGIKVPEGSNKLKVIISIPCNGWGEGLSGPDGSSASLIVDGISKEESINSSMNFHHQNYYKYENCDSFINNFDISGKNDITLKIEMTGAHLDFQEAKLQFS